MKINTTKFGTLIIGSLLLFSNMHPMLLNEIMCDGHKNKNGSLKQELLQTLIHAFNIGTFIESGTYLGQTTEQAAPLFKKIITIELSAHMAKKARKKFKNLSHIQVRHGSSADVLREILPTLDKKDTPLFYLDAHCSGGNTAFDKEGPNSPDGITPIRKELNAIKQSDIQNCVILIDDIRGFGTTVDNKEYISCWAHPTVDTVCTSLLKINPHFTFYLLGDILLAYDQTKHTINVSPLVKACTISRLFNGFNYTNEEVINAELLIAQASGSERQFLKELCSGMMQARQTVPEFHYDLWYGLLYMGEEDVKNALFYFNNVLKKSYHDPRIYTYIAHMKNL